MKPIVFIMAQVAIRFEQDVGVAPMDHDVPDSQLRMNGFANGHHHDHSDSDDNEEEMVNGILQEGTEGEAKTNGNGTTVLANNDRIKKKAKRPSKFLPKDFIRTKSDSQILAAPTIRALKNSRKSRNGYGRGLPKKGKIYRVYFLLGFYRVYLFPLFGIATNIRYSI